MQGGKQPTAAQKKWQNWQREGGCINCGDPASIHHCVGSTAKHNKVHIGQWWTLALCYDCHQGDRGVHYSMMAFDARSLLGLSRKEIEKDFFNFDVSCFQSEFGVLPMHQEVFDAIMDYHK